MYLLYNLLDPDSERAQPNQLNLFPGDINFNTGLVTRLQPAFGFYFGLLVQKLYFAPQEDYLRQIGLNIEGGFKVVCELMDYQWDVSTKLPISRTTKIQYYLDDGTLDTRAKYLFKDYSDAATREKVVSRRRSNSVEWLKGRAKELGLGDTIISYFSQHFVETNRYIQSGDTEIVDLVLNSLEPWMDFDTGTIQGNVREAISLNLLKSIEIPSEQEIQDFRAWFESQNI